MKSLDPKKYPAFKAPSHLRLDKQIVSKKQYSDADMLAQILTVPFDEKFAAEMRALRAAAIAGGMKTLNDEQLRDYVDNHGDRNEA